MNPAPAGPLRSLRIPSGWCVRTHGLHEIDPVSLSDDDPRWEYFEEDLLVIAHAQEQVTLDLGWYPAMRSEGQFRAELIIGEDWTNPAATLSTGNLDEIIAWIEEQLVQAHRLNPPLRTRRPTW